MIPVISVVGWHNSGKTTFLEGLIAELKRRGLRVAVIKHTRHTFEIDREGTDTWRHAQAGSDIVAISGREKFALIEKRTEELPLDEIISRLPTGIDLVIAEGYKQEAMPKIEVIRGEGGAERIATPDELLALISQDETACEECTNCFLPTNFVGVVELLQKKGFLKRS